MPWQGSRKKTKSAYNRADYDCGFADWDPSLWEDDEICDAAIEADPFAIRYVARQTPERCLRAVRANGKVIKFINEQTEDLCLTALNNHGYIYDIREDCRTPKICMEWVQQGGPLLGVPDSVMIEYPEICRKGVQNEWWDIKLVPLAVQNENPDIFLSAVYSCLDSPMSGLNTVNPEMMARLRLSLDE